MQRGTALATLVTVRDMGRAIRFYTRALGATLVSRGEGAMRDSWTALELCGCPVWLIAPEKREKRTMAYSTFLVKDIRSTVAELKRKRVKFQRAEKSGPQTKVEGPIAWEPFGAAAFFKDSEGNLLMVWQTVR
jgi:predicted enzyme related to lactoylglutathione lyase